jgi:hypothetical protein
LYWCNYRLLVLASFTIGKCRLCYWLMKKIKLRSCFQQFLTDMSPYCRHYTDVALLVHIDMADTNRLYDVTKEAGRLRLSMLPIFSHPIIFLTDEGDSGRKAFDLHSWSCRFERRQSGILFWNFVDFTHYLRLKPEEHLKVFHSLQHLPWLFTVSHSELQSEPLSALLKTAWMVHEHIPSSCHINHSANTYHYLSA